mmetsp:Transcript_1018/g.2106  ORF Transcript_1018/g.2106 Transcript_1018/m.2106 type:complete len:296 (-) Transcript_1018:81-968(-)
MRAVRLRQLPDPAGRDPVRVVRDGHSRQRVARHGKLQRLEVPVPGGLLEHAGVQQRSLRHLRRLSRGSRLPGGPAGKRRVLQPSAPGRAHPRRRAGVPRGPRPLEGLVRGLGEVPGPDDHGGGRREEGRGARAGRVPPARGRPRLQHVRAGLGLLEEGRSVHGLRESGLRDARDHDRDHRHCLCAGRLPLCHARAGGAVADLADCRPDLHPLPERAAGARRIPRAHLGLAGADADGVLRPADLHIPHGAPEPELRFRYHDGLGQLPGSAPDAPVLRRAPLLRLRRDEVRAAVHES